MNKQVKQIRNEVERLIRWCNAPFTKHAGVSGEEILNNLLSFIDSLEEEPEVDLEKEIKKEWLNYDLYRKNTILEHANITIAKRLYELGLKAQKGE